MSFIIKCPECSSEYKIEMSYSTFQNNNYKNVKCALCSHTWELSLLEIEKIKQSEENPLPNEKITTYNIKNNQNSNKWVKFFNITIFLIIIVNLIFWSLYLLNKLPITMF